MCIRDRCTTTPAGVDQPGIGTVLVHLVGQHFRVLGGMPDEEGRTKAGREGSLGFGDSHFRSGDLGRIAINEMVHGLVGSQFADRGQYAEGIAGQQDDVLGMSAYAGDLGIRDEIDGIGSSRVFRDGTVRVITDSRIGILDGVLQYRTKANGCVDFRFVIG